MCLVGIRLYKMALYNLIAPPVNARLHAQLRREYEEWLTS